MRMSLFTSKTSLKTAAPNTSAYLNGDASVSACASGTARKRHTPEQRERDRLRKRVARERQTSEQREHEKEREARRCRRRLRPFMAVDGEGGGTDELGRQNYFLMVASGQATGDGIYIAPRRQPFVHPRLP